MLGIKLKVDPLLWHLNDQSIWLLAYSELIEMEFGANLDG